MDAPVLGAFDELTGGERNWQVSMNWRYQRSDRHFQGTHEEPHRKAEGSEVVNTLNLLELGVRYNFSPQTSVSVTLPFLMAERSLPIRDDDRNVIGRTTIQARDLSDMTVVGRRLFWDPAERPAGNLSLGLGLKLPTGSNSVVDTRERYVDGEIVRSLENVDQSIQPGDGGLGVIVDLSGFRLLGAGGHYAAYASGAYLINPRGTNGVKTFRSRETEAIMSVADQYIFRTGLTAAPPGWNGLSFSLGGRIEGVPVHDLIGSSDGFRRPGYAISVEPGVTWSRGPHTLSLAVPIAVQRNRQRSVPDRKEVGRHGDAAFADYVVMLGYWQRF